MAGLGGLGAAVAGRAAASGPKASGPASGAWIDVQERTFKNWVNLQLEKAGSEPISDMPSGFKSGVKLIMMLEQASGKSLGKYAKSPKNKHQEVENLNIAFTFMNKEGLKFVNMQGADVWDGDAKLILGMMWTILYHYQVSKSFKNAGAAGSKKSNAKDLLLEWVRSKIPSYDIQNFTTDWNDGRALCALTNVIAGEPWVLPNHAQMAKEAGLHNCKTGITTAKETLGVPPLISPEDLSNPACDEKSVMMYISYFKDAQRVGSAPAAAADCDKCGAAGGHGSDPCPMCDECGDKAGHGGSPCPKSAKASSGSDLKPWERPADWRTYTGPDLGGRCKIRIYWSSTTSSLQIRKNTEALRSLLERYQVDKRPDWETPIPIDVDMTKEQRDKLFEKAGQRETPMLFVDDEFIGNWEKVEAMNESGELRKVFEY